MENLVYRNQLAKFQLYAVLLILLTVCGSALADDITMTFGDSTPPYAFADTQRGLEVDIVREALAFRGHTLKPVFVPAARVPHQFKQASSTPLLKTQVGSCRPSVLCMATQQWNTTMY